jgi:phage baseplate assembly protein W
MTDNIRDREFLGQGLAFPLRINQQGGISLAKGVQDIEQAIEIILGTTPGERVMRPDFGCGIQELLFFPNNASTRGLIAYYVEEALKRWEPRIDVLEVDAAPDSGNDGKIIINIDYRVIDRHEERSIVYPFYLSGEEPDVP